VTCKKKGADMEQNSIKTNSLRLLSIPEVCKRLGIGHWAVYQQINKRALKTVKIGKRRLVSTKALEDFITSLEK
jgi:excisionase family DNA binding protein